MESANDSGLLETGRDPKGLKIAPQTVPKNVTDVAPVRPSCSLSSTWSSGADLPMAIGEAGDQAAPTEVYC